MLKRPEGRRKMAVHVPLKYCVHFKDDPIGNCGWRLVGKACARRALESHSADPSGDLNPTLTDQHLSVCVFCILAPHSKRNATDMVKEF